MYGVCYKRKADFVKGREGRGLQVVRLNNVQVHLKLPADRRRHYDRGLAGLSARLPYVTKKRPCLCWRGGTSGELHMMKASGQLHAPTDFIRSEIIPDTYWLRISVDPKQF